MVAPVFLFAPVSAMCSCGVPSTSKGAELTAFQPLRPTHYTGCRWFWAWALIGFAVAVGFVSLGLLAVAPAAVVGGLMVSRPVIRRSAFGLLSGAGVLFVYVAWIQRAGPGTTCWQTASASGCDQHLNPLPWAIAGVMLFVGGIIGHAQQN